MMRVGSLFTGIGGFDLGLERAGMTVLWQSEIDPQASAVLTHHWPAVANVGDVTLLDAGRLAAVDVLAGGFPCQDVSLAGRRKGLAGERSGLFFEFARIAAAVRPSWIILENVPGLLTSNFGRDMGTILSTLADLGYQDLSWRVCDSLNFGVPQRRRRLFFVGRAGTGTITRQVLLEPEGRPWRAPQGSETGPGVAADASPGADGGSRRWVTAAETGAGWWNETDAATTLAARDGKGTTTLVASTLTGGTAGRGYQISAEQAAGGHLVAPTITASAGHHGRSSPRGDGTDPLVPVYATALQATHRGVPSSEQTATRAGAGWGGQAIPARAGVRRLTPTECERLQGFPDGWTAPAGADTHRYRCLGNAVTVPVAQWLGERIAAYS